MPKNTVTDIVRPVNDDENGFFTFDPRLVYSRKELLRQLHISGKTLDAMVRDGLPEIVPCAPGKPGKGHLFYGQDLVEFCRRSKHKKE